MPSISQCILFFCLALCASALTTPHVVRHVNHGRSLAARVASPQGPSGGQTLRRRRINSRCNKAPSSEPAADAGNSTTTSQSSTTSSTSTKSEASKSTPVISSALGINLPSFMKGTQTGQGDPSSFLNTNYFAICLTIITFFSGTFYGTGLGACGITNNDNQHIAAVSHLLFDTYPYVCFDAYVLRSITDCNVP
jgi:hypothetical protein